MYFLQKLYYVKNMKIDTEYFPPILPEKNGMISFMILTKEANIFKEHVNGSVLFKIEKVYKNK